MHLPDRGRNGHAVKAIAAKLPPRADRPAPVCLTLPARWYKPPTVAVRASHGAVRASCPWIAATMTTLDRRRPTAALALADGTAFLGFGARLSGVHEGELVFNTSITGYQEILTDPSYAGQIVTFTFPHIGNVGTNDEDIEALTPYARGHGGRARPITDPSNWRSTAAPRRLAGRAGASPPSAGSTRGASRASCASKGRRTRPWPTCPTPTSISRP